MCGKALCFLKSFIWFEYKSNQRIENTIDVFQCPVFRDDPQYPNSHYYFKLARPYDESPKSSSEQIGTGVEFSKEYYFDKFSVSVHHDVQKSYIYGPEDYRNIMKIFERVLTFKEIVRYYNAWVFD